MDAAAFQAGLNWRNQREAKAEKQRTEAQETQTLRKLMAIYVPDRKDEFTSMGLADLRAESMAYAGKAAMANAQAKARAEEQATQQKQVSAAALARVLQDAGSLNEQEVLAEGRGPVRQTRRPVAMTPQRLQTVLARNPAAVNAENFAPNINALRALLTDTTASADAGMPESATMGESDVIFNRKTGQFQISPFSKAAATKKEPEGYVEIPDETNPMYGSRVRVPLSQFRKEYPNHPLLKQLGGGGADATYEAELKLATEALAAGAKRANVAKKFKEKTGKDLPQ